MITTKRTYDDGCPTAHGLDLIGERWALLVVRELMLGPRRFSDIRAGLKGISPNVLSQRLAELEQARIVARRRLPPPNSVWVYQLTDWGSRLDGVMQSLGRWAVESPSLPKDRNLGIVSYVLSLRALFNPAAAVGPERTIILCLSGQEFCGIFGEGRLVLRPGPSDQRDATILSGPVALARVTSGEHSLGTAITAGEVEIVGDLKVAASFLGLFGSEDRERNQVSET
ncbi:MAG: transcriptional regulator [Sphingosinicella sp.]|nr:transcriptional regulator [Sphingosinicella sp.]